MGFNANRRKEIEQEEPETDNVEPQDKDEDPDEDYYSGPSSEDAPREDKSTKDVLTKLEAVYANVSGRPKEKSVDVQKKTSGRPKRNDMDVHDDEPALKTKKTDRVGLHRLTLRIPDLLWDELVGFHKDSRTAAKKAGRPAPTLSAIVLKAVEGYIFE